MSAPPAFSLMHIQVLGAAGLWFVLPPVARADPLKVVASLSGVSPLPFALLTLLIAAVLAGVTVWRLDRQDY